MCVHMSICAFLCTWFVSYSVLRTCVHVLWVLCSPCVAIPYTARITTIKHEERSGRVAIRWRTAKLMVVGLSPRWCRLCNLRKSLEQILFKIYMFRLIQSCK